MDKIKICYDLVGVEKNNFIARFTDKSEAYRAKDWLNFTITGKNYSKVVTVEITQENIIDFNLKNIYGFTFKNFENFKNFMLNKLDNKGTVYKKQTEDKVFVKYDNFWWEYDFNTPLDKATLHNFAGGKQSDVDIRNMVIQEAKDWQFLDWKGTKIYDNNYETGWLSPSGEFFGCDHYNHITQANLLHNLTERDMEKDGWIKITYMLKNKDELVALLGYDNNYNRICPNAKQLSFLQKSNISNLDEIKYYIRISRAQQNNKNNENIM